MREWLVYVVVMAAVFLLLLRDSVTLGSVIGLAASLPLYLLFGWFLAKMGYQRKTLKDLRRETPPRKRRADRAPSSPPVRSRPAPTSRTTTGPSQHRSHKRKKR